MGLITLLRGDRIYLDANIWICALENVADHAATAIATNCITFLTNDKQFRTVPGLYTLLLSQVSASTDEEE